MKKMVEKSMIAVLVMVLTFFGLNINAQFVFPKLPVESRELETESRKLVEAGYRIKRAERYEVFDGKVSANKYTEMVYEFDGNGKIKEVVLMGKSGRTKMILIYLYDAGGLPKRITKFYPTGDILGRYEFRYDRDGFLFEKIEYDQYDYVVQKISYQRNITNNTITESYYNSPQMVTKTIVWEYTNLENGKLTSVKEFDGVDLLKLEKEIIYEQGKIVKEQYKNREGNIIFYHIWSYDANGHLNEIKKEIPGGNIINVRTCQFALNGLITGDINYNSRGSIKTYYKFSYQ